jgi:hypothetical protein
MRGLWAGLKRWSLGLGISRPLKIGMVSPSRVVSVGEWVVLDGVEVLAGLRNLLRIRERGNGVPRAGVERIG